ncbi:cysteine--tRNA ligase [candidate division WOR-3 bacterium]|uniref:Cysteine--tRNA ligase n=1 Tax=candidate division WOR-3 bacterium TaxID=2052148 RepID=A0A937XF97_UNCW3|nr:cysteine--tRNA ligase [candidate division WOR-3 bacterium]
MKLYNTLTRRKEELAPLEPGRVGIYTCGPTVYMFAHVGNFRAYIFSDTLRRVMAYLGYEVKHVMNITDVGHLTSDEDTGEDKLDKEARLEGKSPEDIARFYEKAFFDDAARLNIELPHIVCRATEHIPDMIELIRRIEANGFAYRTSVGLIFDTGKYPEYALLSRLNLAEQQAGARTQVDPERRNPSDFALWITNQPNHLMQWDSPWGRGFPGWHVECSAMSIKYLGECFDIHTGGIDHVPVHHTNERAQNFAATGKEAVVRWMHNAFLVIGDARMGKSEGNLVTISQLEERGISPSAFRYLCQTALYRMPLSFTAESLQSADNSLRGLVDFGRNAQAWPVKDASWTAPFRQEFKAAVADDLNIPQGLAAVWGLVREGNQRQDRAAWETIVDFDRVLGLGLMQLAAATSEVPSQIAELVAARDRARKARDWAESDRLRERIAELGFTVEDTPQGARVKPLS